MTPKVKFHFDLHELHDIEGEAIEVAPGDGHSVYLPIPEALDLRFGLLMRDLRQDRAGGLIGDFC